MGGFRDYLVIFGRNICPFTYCLSIKCSKSSQILNIVQFWSVQFNSEGSFGNFLEIKHVYYCLMTPFESFWYSFLIFWRTFALNILYYQDVTKNDQKLPIFSPRSGSYVKYGLNGLKIEPLGLQTSKIPIFHSKFSQKAI